MTNLLSALLGAALLLPQQQPPPARNPQAEVQELIRLVYAAENESERRRHSDRLALYGEKALAPVRARLEEHVRTRQELRPLDLLITTLDAPSVLEIEEYGPDAEEALETAVEKADGARRATLALLLKRARSAPRETAAVSPAGRLTSVLNRSARPEEEKLLVSLLSDADPHVRQYALEALLHRLRSASTETSRAALAAADRFPETTGRAFGRFANQGQLQGELDLRALWNVGGPWSRAYALRRLNDPALLEGACLHPSRYVRETAVQLLATAKIEESARTRLIGILASDRAAGVREAVLEVARQKPAAFADALVLLAIRETRPTFRHHLTSLLLMSRASPSEESMLAPYRQKDDALAGTLVPLVHPARHPGLRGLLLELRARLPEEQRRPVDYALARFGEETGLRRLETDLWAEDPKIALTAIEEVARGRLDGLGKEIRKLLRHTSPEIAAAARPASVLVARPEDLPDVLKMLKDDAPLRLAAAKRLAEAPRAADAPILQALAPSEDAQVQSAVMDALERLELKEPLPALVALESSKFLNVRERARRLLGRLVYPSQIAATIVDLASVDAKRREDALERFRHTDRSKLRIRVVEGEAARKGDVAEIPVAAAHALFKPPFTFSSELAEILVDEPLPGAFFDLKDMMREQTHLVMMLALRRGRKEEVEAVYARAARSAEVSALVQNLEKARAIHPGAVDGFALAWLSDPPREARREDLAALLSFAVARLAEDRRKELYLALFMNERKDVFYGFLDQVRKEKSALIVPEVVKLHRDGKVKERIRTLHFMGAAESRDGVDVLKEFLADPVATTRMQAAWALGRILHADAVPLLGDAIHDWFDSLKWHVAAELAPGLAPRHQGALKALEARAPEARKPLLEVLLYLAGSEEHRDRFLANYPADAAQRGALKRALAERATPPDDGLIEALVKEDGNLSAPGDLLRLLHRSNTARSAELARRILEDALRSPGISSSGMSFGIELVAARIGDPAADLLAEIAIRWNMKEAVQALGKSGTETAHAALLRAAEQARWPSALAATQETLRAAKRHPALVRKVSATLAEKGPPPTPLNALAVLAYVEGEAVAVDPLIESLKRPVADTGEFEARLAVLQTLMLLPGLDARIAAALKQGPSHALYPFHEWLDATHRIVRGGEPGRFGVETRFPAPPSPSMGAFLWSQARDVRRTADLLAYAGGTAYAQLRPFVELTANRPLPRLEDAQAWAKSDVGKVSERVIREGFAALGYDAERPGDLKRALKDERPFVRWNAIWMLRRRANEPQAWSGPWLEIAPEGSGTSPRWSSRAPTPAEIEAAEKR